jgi:hypothetical protein
MSRSASGSVGGLLERYGVDHDIAGPRVRLAIAWSAAVVVAYVAGTFALGLVFAATAAVGALQAASAARRADRPVNQVLAAVGAASICLAATVNLTVCGLAVIAFAIASVLFPERFDVPGVRSVPAGDGTDPDRRTRPSLRDLAGPAADTLGPALFMGLAGAAAVQVDRVDAMAFIFLFAAISTYDAGDFLCGAGSGSLAVGPAAGMLGVVVVTAAMLLAQPPPLEGAEVVVAGLLVTGACPLGQFLASWLLPSTHARAPGLRRLDAWLLSAPAFLVVCWFAG